MTSTQFSGFWTPSPPCLHFGKIHKSKSTQPPSLRLHFVNPPPHQCRRHLSMAPNHVPEAVRHCKQYDHGILRQGDYQNRVHTNAGQIWSCLPWQWWVKFCQSLRRIDFDAHNLMPCSQLNDRRSAPLPSIKFFPVKIPIVGSMSNESFAVSSDRDRFKWAYKHSRQLESLFLFARILSDCGVSWFEITFYEIMSHYHIW